jgi:hypothetical protein
MKRQIILYASVLTVITLGRALGGEPAYDESPQPHGLRRLRPAGGWNPYGGGVLHWWNPHCFPCQGAPDDYCRKPLPRVCWPPYQPYYTYGPPEICYTGNNGFRDCNKTH